MGQGPGRTGAGDPAEVVPPDLEEDVGERVRVVGPDRAGVSVEPTAGGKVMLTRSWIGFY